MRLLIATRNEGKKREYQELLQDQRFELVTLTDVGIGEEISEDGASYAENALIKAQAYARLSALLTLGDDSGLEVDALDGAPGVYSARYAGPGATDADRYRLLLENLERVPCERRTARFRCVIALSWPDGRSETVEGICEGHIALAPRGHHGFGYDPVFWVDEYGCTMAELPPEVKNRISHRARATALARPILQRALEDGG